MKMLDGPPLGNLFFNPNVRKGYTAECSNVGALLKNTKFNLDMENAIMRFERLVFEDGYATAKNKTFKRPNTKAKEGGSLYVENTDLEPMSVIRADDVETYLRTVTYD